ncbi:MAG: prepilin-type N-terminal cleavage/methylation domain-containing protein [Lachnospiraceae bacterium]|nr:prepilin-type N-terminal cleavage/methylation domain-containing protein [Lachnospiraceae bacterium]
MGKNRGLSLVELLITIAILSVVMVIAVSFMMTGSRSFTKGNADSNVQKEAELTVNQIEDMIIDINGGVAMTDDAAKTEMTMYHTEDDGTGTMLYTKEAVTWNKSDNNVYCSKWKVNYDASAGTYTVDTAAADNYEDQLLAEHVTSFEVDLNDTLTTKALDGTEKTIVKSVLVRVGYDDGAGKVDYATSPIITLRNRMLLSDDPADIFDEATPAADTLKLYYTSTDVENIVPIVDRVSEVTRGNTYNIYARISSGSNINDLVDWEIDETGTLSTIDDSGYLSVGAYEANAYLTITARYKSNPNKKATGVVKVVGDTALKSFKSVHIDPVHMNAFAPQYRAIPVTEGFTQSEEDAITYQWTIKVEGGNKALSDVVESFDGNKKTLDLVIKKDPDNFGRMLEIIVEAHSDITGETRTDSIKYRIDTNGAVDGDSSMERGKLEYDTTYFKMSDKWGDPHWYEYYFCNEYGDRIEAYDSLLGYLQVQDISWDTYQFSFTEGLPRAQEYYVKVIGYYEGTGDGGWKTKWTRERIHYIPPVQIYGKTCFNPYKFGDNAFTFEYTVVGYWENAWANSNPPVYQYDIEEFDYSAPAGVIVTPQIVQTVTHGDDNPIWARGEWSVNSGDWSLLDQIELKSMKIRVSVKDEPSIYAYVTIIFE